MRHLRSLLFAPAVRPDIFAKLPHRGADAVIVDLEDAVPIARKDEAREAARHHIPDLLAAGCTVFLRVNGADTPWFEADLTEGVVPGVAGVLLPKVESTTQSEKAALLLADGVGIVAGIETAVGVADARLALAHPRVSGVYFGAEDFIADLGGIRSEGNAEVAYARSSVALAARLAGVPMYDMVVTRFDDDDRFVREAAEARALGCVGKICVHPRQVLLANAAFSPSPAEVTRAERLVAAYERGVADGLAAIDFDGQMVDGPLADQSRRVLETAAAHGIVGEGGSA